MTVLAGIRTHRWTAAEETLLSTLQSVFGDDVVVVFHDRPDDVTPPIRTIDIDNAWLRDADLAVPKDWGWRCGDYFYYAMRAACPGYNHYWLIEPDVAFSGPAEVFFGHFRRDAHDVLGALPAQVAPGSNAFCETLKHMTPYQALFALTRLSGRAIDTLRPLRVENGRVPVRPLGFANDEVFVFSNAVAHPDLTVGDLGDAAPGWVVPETFRTNPDMLEEKVLADPKLSRRVLHPVKKREIYKSALAARLTKRMGILKRMHPELADLTDDDFEDIADQARIHILTALRRHGRNRR